MTISISTTQYFLLVACGWNIFYDLQAFFKSCCSKSKIYLFSSLASFSTSALYIKFGVRHWFWRRQVFFSLQLPPYLMILGWNNDLLCLLLLMIYCSWKCNWFLLYFYWKSCTTCSFSENVSLADLKIYYQCLFSQKPNEE